VAPSRCRGYANADCAALDLPSAWSANIAITLRDGHRIQAQARDYKGMPQTPMKVFTVRTPP
jgi:hypothetical protein